MSLPHRKQSASLMFSFLHSTPFFGAPTMCTASTVNRASSQLGFQSDGRNQHRNTHSTLGASVRAWTRQAQKYSKSKGNPFLWWSGKISLSSLLPYLPLSFHICSLIYLKRYLWPREGHHSMHLAQAESGLLLPQMCGPLSGLLGPSSHSPLLEPCSPSKILLNLLPWCWAQPCCFLPSFWIRPCFWKHCPQL